MGLVLKERRLCAKSHLEGAERLRVANMFFARNPWAANREDNLSGLVGSQMVPGEQCRHDGIRFGKIVCRAISLELETTKGAIFEGSRDTVNLWFFQYAVSTLLYYIRRLKNCYVW
jgi:hypothetical protein